MAREIMGKVFFLIGAPRSGTTAYTRILNIAVNVELFSEQPPKLQIESRNLTKGKLYNPEDVLWESKQDSIRKTLKQGKFYGDKNPCYMPFIPYLFRLWDCKVVFLVRDGRDVVRSLMDWHDLKAHNIYIMREDDEQSHLTQAEDDPWDYSRLRPEPGDHLFTRWRQLSRFQKCAWYWTAFNAMALEKLSRIDPAKWMLVDVSRANVETVESVFDFLGLQGFDQNRVSDMMASRINSVPDRTQANDAFPKWPDWTSEQQQQFDELAGAMMARLNYY